MGTQTFVVTPEIEQEHTIARIGQSGLYDLIYHVDITCKCGETKQLTLNASYSRAYGNMMDEEINKKMHEHRMDVAAKQAQGSLAI